MWLKLLSLLKALPGWVRGWSLDTDDTIEESAQEAAQQRYNKSAKIETAAEAVLVHDLQHLAADDRDAVRRFRDMKVFGGKGGSSSPANTERDDMLIADNIRINHIKPSGLLPALLGAGLVAGLWWMTNKDKPAPTPPAATATDASATGRIRVFWGDKELKPGEPAKVEVEEKSQ